MRATWRRRCYHFARMSSPLTALSPLDGRYAAKTRALQDHFSEFALMRERVAIEVAWLAALAGDDSFTALAPFSPATVAQYAKDVSTFLTWTAEPHMEARKRLGLQVFAFLILLTGLLYFTKKKVWADAH